MRYDTTTPRRPSGGSARTLLRLLAALALTAWWCAPALAEHRTDHVTLQLKWFHQFQFAGYYAAQEQGYYRDEGLAVTIEEGGPGIDVYSEVLEGRATFGTGGGEILLRHIAGEPVVALAVIFQHSPSSVLSLESSRIHSPHDLVGKRIMMSAEGEIDLKAMLLNEGVALDDVVVAEPTWDIRDLLEGRVDAMAAYSTNTPFPLLEQGVSYTLMTPATYGVDFYGDGLFADEQTVRERPDAVEAFSRASLKGWEYALDHPGEMIELIRKRYNPDLPAQRLRFEAEATRRLIAPDLVRIGHMNPGRWEHMAQTYAALGVIDPDYSLDGFLYEPDAAPDHTKIWITAGLSLLVTMAVGTLALYLFMLNRKLRHAEHKAQVSSEAKSQLLMAITHEVRTPLNGILGMLQAIDACADSEQVRDHARVAQEAGWRMSELFSKTLELIELEAGEAVLQEEDFPLRHAVEAAAASHRQAAERKGLDFSLELDPQLPETVHGDRQRLHQVLTKLLENAVRHTERGSVTLRAAPDDRTTAPPFAGREQVLFTVADTGRGMPAPMLAALFTTFARADVGYSRLTQGLGLGMVLTARIVALMGGRIEADSAEGQGATFTVSLPFAPPGGPAPG